jgi:ATP-dependent RNA helicase DDX52/ROK1
LVIDEADKLFEMGFLEQMDEIVAECNGLSVQKSIFSATINMQVENLAKSIMSKPLSIFVGQKYGV